MPRLPENLPLLTDGQVTLRDPLPQDLVRTVEACRDPQSRHWLPLPTPYDQSNARQFVEMKRAGRAEGRCMEWAIESAGRWVGNIGLHDQRGNTFEVGFMVHPDARASGICRRALRLLAGYALDTLGLDGLTWRAARGNFGSRRVAWACGFTMDGTWPVPHPVSDRSSVHGIWLGHLDATDLRAPAVPWLIPPVLDGGRFVLRPWRDDDVPRAEPDAVSARYLHDAQPTPESYAEWLLTRRERMADGGSLSWCIADADIDEPLGCLAVQHLQDSLTGGTGHLSYWLYPAARGLGLLQESLDLVIAHAFAPMADRSGTFGLGLHRLQAGTDVANRPSARALRRAGFRQVAQERAVLAHQDRAPSGALTFELVAGDDRLAQSIEPAVIATIRTPRLLMRPWRQEDCPPGDVELDRAALRFMPAAAQPTQATWQEWFERRMLQIDVGQVLWCIADATTDQALGSVALFDPQTPVGDRAEIGYWLYPAARGRGYAAEAVRAVVAHGFTPPSHDGLGLRRIEAETDAENLASHRLLRDRGFREWGRARANYTRADGSISDSIYFELLAEDHLAQKDVADLDDVDESRSPR